MAILQRKDWRKRRRNLPKHTCPARRAVAPLRDLPAQTVWPQNALPHRDSSLYWSARVHYVISTSSPLDEDWLVK